LCEEDEEQHKELPASLRRMRSNLPATVRRMRIEEPPTDLPASVRRMKSHMRVQRSQEPPTDLPASVRRMKSHMRVQRSQEPPPAGSPPPSSVALLISKLENPTQHWEWEGPITRTLKVRAQAHEKIHTSTETENCTELNMPGLSDRKRNNADYKMMPKWKIK